MAEVNIIQNQKWTNTSGDPGNNTLNVYCDSVREESSMKYTLRFVYSVGAQSWYNWRLLLRIWLDNQLYTPTDLQIKSQTSDRIYGWTHTKSITLTVPNKVSGNTNLKFTTYGVENGSTVPKLTYTYALPVIAIGNPTISNIEASNAPDSSLRYLRIKAKATVSSIGSGATSITSRKYEIFRGNTSISLGNWTDGVYIYSDKDGATLYPNTTYTVIFTATNNAGLSTKNSIDIKTPSIVAPSVRPTNLAVSPTPISTTTADLILKWNKPNSGLGSAVGKFGYKLNVYKNGTKINLERPDPDGKPTTFYWTENYNNSIEAPQRNWCSHSITYKSGDTLYFVVTPFVYYKGVFYTNDAATKTSELFTVISDTPKFSVLTSSGWKNGKIFIRDGNQWKQAKAIWVKSGNTWVKSK